MLCDALLEGAVRLVLQNAEGWEIRRGPIPLVESSQIEAFVLRKSVIGDYLNEL